MMRSYHEQLEIPDFSLMNRGERRSQVLKVRTSEIINLRGGNNRRRYKQTRKNYRNTDSYIHLTLEERRDTVRELAETIANWDSIRLFAECIDKIHFDPARTVNTPDEQAFEQVVSRFERFLQNTQEGFGILIHDNNPTVAKRHTEMMRKFLLDGTLWTQVQHIIETPMFVDSQLTGMVQLSDLCAYALRRYLENSETELFNLVFERADRIGSTVVGVRHFTEPTCACEICAAHRPVA